MTDSQLLKSLVDEYQLEANGVKFWTPYFVNTPQVHDDAKRANLPGPYLGKGTPAQLKNVLLKRLEKTSIQPKTAGEYRQFMHDNLIGVECSGFAYYVYDQYIGRKFKKSLSDHLFWSRDELLEAFDRGIPWHHRRVNRNFVSNYPEHVSLSQVSKDWGWKSPSRLVRADRFWHEPAARVVDSIKALRATDMITMREKVSEISHLVIVTSVDEGIIRYAHASRIDPTKLGGVHYQEIKVTDLKAPIGAQTWLEQDFFKAHDHYHIRRLKVLDGE